MLKKFSRRLQETARKANVVCRIGGDEFAVILPETELSNVPNFLNRLGSNNATAGAAASPSKNLFTDEDAVLRAAKPTR